jgi:membrane associated rhomboid family serine protease
MEIATNKERKWYLILFFPIVFVAIILLVKLIEIGSDINFYEYGIYPRRIRGLVGIFFAPILHGDFSHIISNAIPLLVLGGGLFYYFKDLGYKVFFLYILQQACGFGLPLGQAIILVQAAWFMAL